MQLFKKIISLFLSFAMVFSFVCISVYAVDYSSKSDLTFWDWYMRLGQYAAKLYPYFGDLIAYSYAERADGLCSASSDGYHHASDFIRVAGDIGYAKCSFCGDEFTFKSDDLSASYDTYVSTLDSTTASSSVAVTGFSVGSFIGFGSNPRVAYEELVESSPDKFMQLLKSLGINDKVAIYCIGTRSPYELFGFFWDATGCLCLGRFNNPVGQTSSVLGVYSLSDLTLIDSTVCNFRSGTTDYSGGVYYSKSYAEQSSDFTTKACCAIDFTTPFVSSDSRWCFTADYKTSSGGTWKSGRKQFFIYQYFPSNSSQIDVSTVIWDNSRIDVAPSGTDSSTRTASLMQTINNYNIDNSYTDNSTVVNYFIGSLADDGSVSDIYAPNLFDEDTMIFTDPETGTEYQAAGWLYNYVTRTYGIAFDSGVLSVNGTGVDYVRLTYGDNAVTVEYFQGDAETLVSSSSYAYVMASQSACNINGHSYSAETTKEPTCTAAGERTYTCSVCGNQYVEEISKTDHTYTDYTITQEPTCTAGGIAMYTCSTCGAQITEKLDALDHDWLATEVKETTYAVPEGTSCPKCSGINFTSARSSITYTCTCSDCGTEWTVEADVTFGSTTYTCSRCGETKIEADATEENQESWFAKFISKFRWLSSVSTIYKQLVADVTSDAATAAAVADGAVMLADVTSDHADADGDIVTYTAPELAISFGESDMYGVDWANIRPLDLSWYAPHKKTVDGILSGILWLSYLFLLIKRAPGIIQGAEMVTEDSIKIDNWQSKHGK